MVQAAKVWGPMDTCAKPATTPLHQSQLDTLPQFLATLSPAAMVSNDHTLSFGSWSTGMEASPGSAPALACIPIQSLSLPTMQHLPVDAIDDFVFSPILAETDPATHIMDGLVAPPELGMADAGPPNSPLMIATFAKTRSSCTMSAAAQSPSDATPAAGSPVLPSQSRVGTVQAQLCAKAGLSSSANGSGSTPGRASAAEDAASYAAVTRDDVSRAAGTGRQLLAETSQLARPPYVLPAITSAPQGSAGAVSGNVMNGFGLHRPLRGSSSSIDLCSDMRRLASQALTAALGEVRNAEVGQGERSSEDVKERDGVHEQVATDMLQTSQRVWAALGEGQELLGDMEADAVRQALEVSAKSQPRCAEAQAQVAAGAAAMAIAAQYEREAFDVVEAGEYSGMHAVQVGEAGEYTRAPVLERERTEGYATSISQGMGEPGVIGWHVLGSTVEQGAGVSRVRGAGGKPERTPSPVPSYAPLEGLLPAPPDGTKPVVHTAPPVSRVTDIPQGWAASQGTSSVSAASRHSGLSQQLPMRGWPAPLLPSPPVAHALSSAERSRTGWQGQGASPVSSLPTLQWLPARNCIACQCFGMASVG
jgi:hypothetical protein